MAWVMVGVSAFSALSGILGKKKAQKSADTAADREAMLQDRQLALAEKQDARSEQLFQQYKELYMPAERKLVADAFGNELSPAAAESRATADVRDAMASAKDSNMRRTRSLGIDPSSGASLALDRDTDLAGARIEAGARTRARESTRDRNFARQADVLSIGRGLPATATSMTAAAQSGVNNAADLASARSRYTANIASQAGEQEGESLGSLAGVLENVMKNRKKPSPMPSDPAFTNGVW